MLVWFQLSYFLYLWCHKEFVTDQERLSRIWKRFTSADLRLDDVPVETGRKKNQKQIFCHCTEVCFISTLVF